MEMVVAAPADALRPVDEYRTRVAYFLDVRGLRPCELGIGELKAYGWPAAGWAITLPTTVGDRQVDVLLPLDYPYKPARIGVFSLPGGLLRAHIAEHLMCLTDTVERHRVRGDELVLARDLDRAAERFADDEETVRTDRRAEFADYWNRNVSSPPIWTLLSEDSPFGLVSAWHGKRFILVGSDGDAIKHWYGARFGVDVSTLSRALYLPGDPLDVRLESGDELRALVDESGDDKLKRELEDLAVDDVGSATIIFRLPGPFALVGGILRRGARPSGVYKAKTRHPGFRPGHAPHKMLVDKYFAAGPTVEHHRIQRVDADWVIARGGEPTGRALKHASVCLVGVGSLGSGIARALIKAGVGRLVLVDPDILTWDNVARHELGGRYVGHFKAAGIAETLRRDFPIAQVEAHNSSWQDAYRRDPVIFDADVVLATTGDWATECQLTELLRPQARPIMVFGWIEPHAAAAHALVVQANGGCLGCGMYDTGEFAFRAIDWPEPQLVRVAACGASYTPYSDLAASRARTMIAGEVLTVLADGSAISTLATELYDESLRAPHGGVVTERLAERLGRPPLSHGDFVRSEWPRQSDCAACARKKAQSAA
jgi:hypothetical protein